jgi:RNA polymerase sigma factor (sigma-70 family)
MERWDRLQAQPWVVGWIVTTALNLARRGLRRRHVLMAAPGAASEDREEVLDLWAAVASLPLRQQQAVVLRYRTDLPVEEVARAMDCSEGTVRTHLARGREALRRHLEEVDASR